MSDEIDRDEEQALTAEYVLGLLSAEEEAAFEEVLVVDPSLREAYAFWADRLVALTDDLPQVPPPARVLSAIRAELFGGETRSRGSWWTRLGLIPAMAGGLAAAAAVLLLLNVYDPFGGGTPVVPELQAQIAAEDQSLVVLAAFDADTDTLRLERTAGGAAPDGRVRQLWLIAGDQAPVSLGLLSEGETSTLSVDPALVAALSGGTLAISDEPTGGSPTGAPTGAVLAVGQVSEPG